MRIVAIVCNVVLIGLTGFVTLTDGAPKEISYIVFSLLLFLIPILNVVVFSRSSMRGDQLDPHPKEKDLEEHRTTDTISSVSTGVKIVSIIGNIVLFGFVCWALIDQYPHPEEDGVLAFSLLAVLTPILSLLMLLRSGTGAGGLSHLRKKPEPGKLQGQAGMAPR